MKHISRKENLIVGDEMSRLRATSQLISMKSSHLKGVSTRIVQRLRSYEFSIVVAAIQATLEFARAVSTCKARANDVGQAHLIKRPFASYVREGKATRMQSVSSDWCAE